MSIKVFIKLCQDTYYKGNPIIDDDQYDHLVELYGEDSIGSAVGSEIPHWEQMWSLQKHYTDEMKKEEVHPDYTWSRKYDGAAISLLYLDGLLTRVLTRGDGIKGKDITHLFVNPIYQTDPSTDEVVPSCLDEFEPEGLPPVLQVTGEIITCSNMPNSRNYASGALGLKRVEDFVDKALYFRAYGIAPYQRSFYSEDMHYLEGCGFTTVFSDENQHHFKFDGDVFRININAIYDSMGYTSKHPKGAFAIKERSEGVKTKILDVVWQTGKSGKVTPVAILEPVEIEDAMVGRATLNNVGFIEALGVEIGDEVMVERAGGIIPRIIKKAE
jgi:DNA ligase (NAD+)